jgi:hypothetical protein
MWVLLRLHWWQRGVFRLSVCCTLGPFRKVGGQQVSRLLHPVSCVIDWAACLRPGLYRPSGAAGYRSEFPLQPCMLRCQPHCRLLCCSAAARPTGCQCTLCHHRLLSSRFFERLGGMWPQESCCWPGVACCCLVTSSTSSLLRVN